MKTLRHLLLLICVQAVHIAVFSQKRHIQFGHIGTNMGLSQSKVTYIYQDSRGFMWFGTRDGLNKYDGYKFTVYKNDEADSKSICHNSIQYITEDADGNLWIGTWGGGLDVFDRAKEVFIHKQLNNKTLSEGGLKLINCVFKDSEGNMWVGTEGQGLQMYDKKNNSFISYIHDDNDPKSISDDRAKDIAEDADHNLWIGTSKEGLNFFNRKTKTFRRFQHDDKNNKSICSNAILCMYKENNRQLWIGTRGAGLDMFDMKTEEFVHYPYNPDDANSLQSRVVQSISKDELGNLWVATENGGLAILNSKTKTFDNYLQDDADAEGINNNSIVSLCRDIKGNMWIGTFSAGINFVNADANKFVHYRHNSSSLSLSNNNVLSILEDSKGNLWLGTDGGGLNLFDPQTAIFKHYTHQNNPNSICGDYVLKIFEDSDGNLWIGTWGDGVTVFNKEKNTFKHFRYDKKNPKGIGGDNVWTIGEDGDKNIWLGFYGSPSGADMYNKKTGVFKHYISDPSNPNSLGSNTVNNILKDKEGNLWIATNGGGLNLFNKETDGFSYINKKSKNPISDNDVFCTEEDEEGNLWIGTNTGLNKLDKKTGKVTSYFIEDGLPSNTICGIIIDKGILWISTFNGLSRFDPATNSFKNFGPNDGLQSKEFKMNSCYKSRTGKLYFGGINGFNGFSPDDTKEKKYESPLVLTDFQIFNKQVPIKDSVYRESPLKENITDTKEIVLSHKQSVISFEFASLDYGGQENRQYSYMLEGFDKDWNYIGTRHSATYTNLDAGDYTFKVRALTNQGWSTNVASLHLIIKPPFWLTWWFKLIAVVTVVGGVFAFFKYRISSIQSQKIKLQEKVQEQTAQLLQSARDEQTARYQVELANKELERKNKELEQFAYVASHDMQEPLRTTSSFVELLQQQYKGKLDEKADKYLNFIVQSSDRMKVLIKDLLDYSRIGRKKELNKINCNELIKEVLADLDTAIKESNAAITVKELPVISGYPTEMKQLFQNLLMNAMKFKKPGIAPEIKIEAHRNNGSWEFMCRDNGIGVDKQHQDRIFIIFQRLHTRNEYEGSGIGLAHCKKIVELHGGKIWIESVPQEGSTFHFTFPYKGIHEN